MGGVMQKHNFNRYFNTGKEGLVTVVMFSCSVGCNYISGANKQGHLDPTQSSALLCIVSAKVETQLHSP